MSKVWDSYFNMKQAFLNITTNYVEHILIATDEISFHD